MSNHFDWFRITTKQIELAYNGTNYPLKDTTINSAYGHFIWAAPDFRNNRANQTSRLYSEILLAYQYQGGACLTFSYFVTGASGLYVYVRNRPTGQQSRLLWTVENDQSRQWYQEALDIPTSAADFEVDIRNPSMTLCYILNILCNPIQVFFEGKFIDPSKPGSIALDDLHIHASPCSQIGTTPSPLVPFDCGDGTIVPQSSVWYI